MQNRVTMANQTIPRCLSGNKAHSSTDPEIKYINDNSLRLTPAQAKLIQITKDHPDIILLSSAEEMQFLASLVKSIKGEKTLDVGVYTGYSAMTIALALPDHGKVIAVDINEDYVNIGRPFWKEDGVEGKIDVKIGPAVQTLEQLLAEGEAEKFDFAFIDADKPNYPRYYELCFQLIRPGGIIALDNMLLGGRVYSPDYNDERTQSIRKVTQMMKADDRIDFTILREADGIGLAFKH